MNNKAYILLKDLPIWCKGGEFILSPDGDYVSSTIGNKTHYLHLPKDWVENNPDWFIIKEDDEIAKAKELLKNKGFKVVCNSEEYDLSYIMGCKLFLEAKEYLVTNDPVLIANLWHFQKRVNDPSFIKYTETDMLKCFNYAMEYGFSNCENPRGISSLEFKNYLNSLNKK